MNNEVQAPLRIPQLSNFTRQPHLRPTSPNVFLLSIRRHSSGYQRNDLCVCSSCKVDGPGFESFRIHFPNFHRHRLAANRNSAASSVSNLALLLAVGQAAVTLSTDVNGSQLDASHEIGST